MEFSQLKPRASSTPALMQKASVFVTLSQSLPEWILLLEAAIGVGHSQERRYNTLAKMTLKKL